MMFYKNCSKNIYFFRVIFVTYVFEVDTLVYFINIDLYLPEKKITERER